MGEAAWKGCQGGCRAAMTPQLPPLQLKAPQHAEAPALTSMVCCAALSSSVSWAAWSFSLLQRGGAARSGGIGRNPGR